LYLSALEDEIAIELENGNIYFDELFEALGVEESPGEGGFGLFNLDSDSNDLNSFILGYNLGELGDCMYNGNHELSLSLKELTSGFDLTEDKLKRFDDLTPELIITTIVQ
jgi:hypothetical protein